MSLHVPASPIWQSCGFGLPQSQIGHGRVTVLPRCTREFRCTCSSDAPLARSYVPVTSLAKRLTMHTGTPPAESGSGGPNVLIVHVPLLHWLLSVHETVGSFAQREPTFAK